MKRKRLQMIRSKQQKTNREQIDDDNFDDYRQVTMKSLFCLHSDFFLIVFQDDDHLSINNEHPTHFFCDIDDCSQVKTKNP